MARDNNNGLFAYSSKSGAFAVGAKVNKVAYSWESIYTESHAKRHRAMYPHQYAIGKFVIGVELNGYTEQRNFLNFLKGYSETAIYGDAQPMWVAVDSRAFARFGFPVKGLNEEEHVGSAVFRPQIIFESVTDPLDPTLYTQTSPSVSQWDLSGTENDVKNFFYPFSRASSDTSIRPETIYDLDGPGNPAAADLLNPGAVGSVAQQGGKNLSGAVGGARDALNNL